MSPSRDPSARELFLPTEASSTVGTCPPWDGSGAGWLPGPRRRRISRGGNAWLGELSLSWVYEPVDWLSGRPRRDRPPKRLTPPGADARGSTPAWPDGTRL
jgi:hypothetical protein